MIRTILAHLAAALDIWRNEPDPATADTDPDDADEQDDGDMDMDTDTDTAIAAGLTIGGGLDGFEGVYAVQGMILADLHRNAIRQAWGDQLN